MSAETPHKKLSLGGVRRRQPQDDKDRVRTGARARTVAINNFKTPRSERQDDSAKSSRKDDNVGKDRGTNQRGERTSRPPRDSAQRGERSSRPPRNFDGRYPSHSDEGSGLTKRDTHAPRTAARTAGDTKDKPNLSDRLVRGARPIELQNQYQHVHTSYHDEIFSVFAPCPVGLEEALAAELDCLGFEQVQAARSGVRFTANWLGVMRANLYSRLAIRILVQVAHARVETEDDIYELARQVTWERWFGAEQTLRVDTSAIRSSMQSLQFCNLRAKDGIVDRLRGVEGERPSIDTVRPDAKVHLFLDSESATLYLDTSGESLFKRGWRFSKGQAPLRENLAAGLLALSSWNPSKPLYDPFCGSGTILIEAAWIAQGVPPGIMRPFSFERLRGFHRSAWLALKEQAYDNILPSLETPIFGSDADPMVIEAAQENLGRAQLSPTSIRFEVADALQVKAPASEGFLISNPPYGERLGEQDVEFWRTWSSVLKNEFANWQVYLISNDMDLPKKLRLKPRCRIPVFNGDIECRLFGFEMVSEGYRNKT